MKVLIHNNKCSKLYRNINRLLLLLIIIVMLLFCQAEEELNHKQLPVLTNICRSNFRRLCQGERNKGGPGRELGSIK
jgi:hypothetical protein